MIGGKYMEIILNSKNYKITDDFKKIAEKKLKKLEKVFNDDENVTATVSITKEKTSYKTTLVVKYRAFDFRAESEDGTPYDAIDIIIPRVEGQIRKQKDIWGKSKKGTENVYDEDEEKK